MIRLRPRAVLLATLLAVVPLTACDVAGPSPEPTVTLTTSPSPTSPPPTPGTKVSGAYLAGTAIFRNTPSTTTYAFTVRTRIALSGPGGRTDVKGSGVVSRSSSGATMRTSFVLSGDGPDVPYRSVLIPDGLYLQGAPGVPGTDETAFVRIPATLTSSTATRLRSQYGSTDGYDPEVQREVLLALDQVEVLPDGKIDGVTVHRFRHVTSGADEAGQLATDDAGLAGQVKGLTVTTTTSVDDQGRVIQLSSATTGVVEGRDLDQSQVLTFTDYGKKVDTGLPADARVVALPAG